MTNKFFLRLNSRELNASSKYIWPEDFKKLYLFNKKYLEQNPLTSLELISSKEIEEENTKKIIVTISLQNGSSLLIDYLTKKGNLIDGVIMDTFDIKTAHNEEYINFDWGWDEQILSNNIKLAKVNSDKLNLREGYSIHSKIIKTLNKNDEIIYDDDFKNSHWRKGVVNDENGIEKIVYFSKQLSESKNVDFYNVKWYDGFGILLLTILAIVVMLIVFPLLLVGSIRLGISGGLYVGLILLGLTGGTLWIGYQLLESAIFELFLINLPH
jgi:hypothetical protein